MDKKVTIMCGTYINATCITVVMATENRRGGSRIRNEKSSLWFSVPLRFSVDKKATIMRGTYINATCITVEMATQVHRGENGGARGRLNSPATLLRVLFVALGG